MTARHPARVLLIVGVCCLMACAVGVARGRDGAMVFGVAVGHAELSTCHWRPTPSPTTGPSGTPAPGLLARLMAPPPAEEPPDCPHIAGGTLSPSFTDLLGNAVTGALAYFGLH